MQTIGVEPYVSIEVLAKTFMVSISTIRTWMRAGYIPNSTYIKIGATYRFQPKRVEAALTAVSNQQDPEKAVQAVKYVETETVTSVDDEPQEQLAFTFKGASVDDDI